MLYFLSRNAHLEIIVLAETELSNLNLHWIDDGKTAVPVLLRNDHGETALWGLRYNITGYKKRDRQMVDHQYLAC